MGSALATSLRVTGGKYTPPEETLTSYPEVFNYLLKTYETDDLIGDADLSMRNYTKKPNQKDFDYANGLWMKFLRM